MSYDTQMAYIENQSKKLASEDKASVKAVADKALADINSYGDMVNQNYDNGVQAAYIQQKRNAQGLNSETSQIRNDANTYDVIESLKKGQKYNMDLLDLERQRVNDNTNKLNADIDAGYDPSRDIMALKEDQLNANRQLKFDREEKQAQEGYMDNLLQIAADNDYNYDFDADIFALIQAGYDSNDWRIQYLKEAKRLQNRQLAEIKASQKGSSRSGNPYYDDSDGLGDPFVEESGLEPLIYSGNSRAEVENDMIDKIEARVSAGLMSEEEAERILNKYFIMDGDELRVRGSGAR